MTLKIKKITARSRLLAGPTTAMKNSSLGRRGSDLSTAAPPKMKSVMLSTFMPRASAMKEWANS